MPRTLPPRMHNKHGAFYFVDKANKWHRLGITLGDALRVYAEWTAKAPEGSMLSLIDSAMPVICARIAASTKKQYEQAAKKLRLIFVEFKPEDVKPKHVAQVKLALAKTPNMANRVITVLRLIFAYAVENQLVEWNPCIGIKHLLQRVRTRLLTHDEIAAIKAHAPPRLRCMIDVLYLTGQRVGDILVLQRSALTDAGIVFEQEKTGARLIVEWAPDLRAAVEAAKALPTHFRSKTLFHTHKGGQIKYETVWEQWVAACRKAGVEDANIHDLRALSITDADDQGSRHAGPRRSQRSENDKAVYPQPQGARGQGAKTAV